MVSTSKEIWEAISEHAGALAEQTGKAIVASLPGIASPPVALTGSPV